MLSQTQDKNKGLYLNTNFDSSINNNKWSNAFEDPYAFEYDIDSVNSARKISSLQNLTNDKTPSFGYVQSLSPADINGCKTRPLSVPGNGVSMSSSYSSGSPNRQTSTTPPTPVRETNIITKDYDPVSGNKRINNYEIIKELGRGCHGKVKLGRDVVTNELVAIKIVNKNTRRRFNSRSLISTQLAKVQKEIAILKKCNHPYVVELKEVIDDPSSKKIYMILEYMDGGEVNFNNKIDEVPILDKETIRHIMRNVIAGLQYLHAQGIIHRDIKPANLLWSSDGSIKISDFGVSFCRREPSISMQNRRSSTISSNEEGSNLSESPPSPDEINKSIPIGSLNDNLTDEDELELAKTAGSPAFFAPELCWAGEDGQPRPKITAAIDVWALGITLYCMAYGRPPFMAETEYDLFELIPKQPLTFPPEAERDPDLEDLLIKLLEKDPTKRISLDAAINHPFIIKGLSDVQGWNREADPQLYPKVVVTEDEVKRAVTIKDKIRKHLRKLSESFIKVFSK